MDHSQHGQTPVASTSFFDQTGFMPHGHCYLWKSELVFVHVISDLLIGLAYVTIAGLLIWLVRKIRLPFGPIFLAFGTFIAACGFGHFVEIWTLWNPDYWFLGFVKAVTATASVITCFALHRLSPRIMEFAHTARLSEERKTKLESAHAELEVLYEKVKETDVLKTQFFSNVSHELRTPLSLIIGPMEDMMKDQNLSDQQRSQLSVMARNAKTLLKQVNDLLDISKLEAGRMKPRYGKADLVKLLRYVTAHFETVMQSRNIFLSIQAPDSVMADVDQEKVQRVFMNLLSNAVKFTPEGGRIRLSLKEDPHQKAAVFTIEDNGPGIPVELRSVIFERFRQGDGGTTRKVGGTGLGLAIVKDFVEMHGGSVRLLNGQFHGAVFVVNLPLVAPEGSHVADPVEPGGEIEELMLEGSVHEIGLQTSVGHVDSTPKGDRPTVLVCEDNPDMNQFIAETLARNFSVLRAIDGREGFEKAKVFKPDLIVSDIMMPYMSGDQLVKQLKEEESLKDIPILLLSARADDEMRFRLLREGASDYIVKPFASEELRARATNLVTIRTTRSVLERELSVRSDNILEMAKELSAKKREAELATSVAEAAKQEAEKASEMKSAFLSLVSHELNTPLMAMSMTIEMLNGYGRETLNDLQKELLARLGSSSKQLKTLVEGLFEYVRGDRADGNRMSDFSLNELVKLTMNDFSSMASEKGLKLEMNLKADLKNISSDATKVKVILNNLVVNALKFTENGFVRVETRTNPVGRVELVVEDSGPGIPKADQERIFEPYERLEPIERKSIPGMGLGLSLVKQLVGFLGAKLSLNSEVGQGTVFTIEFK